MAQAEIVYRCAFVLNRTAIIWDDKCYTVRTHAYNRLDKLKETNNYRLKYGKGSWEVMYSSGWKRDNNKQTQGVNTVKWVEAVELDGWNE